MSYLFLALAIACRAIADLQLHSKLKGQKGDDSFWGEESHYRKYANPLDAPPDNWYSKLAKLKYKERWFTSTNLTVFLTDGFHFMQWNFFNLLSLGITLLIDFGWWTLLLVWCGMHLIHWATYRFLQR